MDAALDFLAFVAGGVGVVLLIGLLVTWRA